MSSRPHCTKCYEYMCECDRYKRITGKYKGKPVSGNRWFLLGDSYWLILSKTSAKRVGKEAIPMDAIRNISSYP